MLHSKDVGSSRSDEELMAAYVAGDAAALDEIFARYAPWLLSFLRRGLSGSEPRDLLQETFLHLHRSRHDFRTDARLRPWLFTIAVNVKRQYLRRERRRNEVALDPIVETLEAPSRSQASLDIDAQVQEALAELPADQREVILLHWMAGRPFDEVARTVGATVSAAKVRAHRGYSQLRILLSRVTGREVGAYTRRPK